MIAIKNENGKYFDLFPDTKIQWVRQNPFFREDIDFDTEASLPFELPYSINNSALLKYADQLQTNSYLYQVNATVEFAGNEYYKGILTVLKGSRKGFTIAITHNIPQFDMDALLSDLPFEAPFAGAAPDLSDLDSTVDELYPAVKFQFPEVINHDEEFIRDYGTVKSNPFYYINLFDPTGPGFHDNVIPVPMVFWEYILDLIQEKLKLSKITGLWRLKCKTENYMLYNPVHIIHEDPRLALTSYPGTPVVNNERGRDTSRVVVFFKSIGYSIHNLNFNVPLGTVIDLAIRIKNTSGTVSTITISHTVISADLANNDISLMEALETDILAASGNFSSDGVQTNTTDNLTSLHIEWTVANQYIDELESTITVTFPGGLYSYKPIELKKHVPNISIRDTFNIIKDWFCLSFDYNIRKNELVITHRKDLLVTEEKNYTSKLNGMLVATVNDPAQYAITWENDESDLRVEKLGDKTVKSFTDSKGLEIAEIDIPAGTTYKETAVIASGATGTVLSVDQPVGDYENNVIDPPFRLVKYLGYIANSLTQPYPAATNVDLTPSESYEQYWEPWINFIKSSRKDFEGEFFLDYADLVAFDPRRRWRIESNVLIWREIRTTMTMTGIEPSTVKLRKI